MAFGLKGSETNHLDCKNSSTVVNWFARFWLVDAWWRVGRLLVDCGERGREGDRERERERESARTQRPSRNTSVRIFLLGLPCPALPCPILPGPLYVSPSHRSARKHARTQGAAREHLEVAADEADEARALHAP